VSDDALTNDIQVKVWVSALSGPLGRVVAARLIKGDQPAPEMVTLGPFGQEPLTLTGQADAEGSYTGELTIESAGVRTAFGLTLTRTRPDFDIKIDPIARLRDAVGDGVALRVHAQNPTGVARDFYRPEIARLDRVDASGSSPVDVGVGGYSVSYSVAGQTQRTADVPGCSTRRARSPDDDRGPRRPRQL
jgi:hypothetical protein